MKRRDMILKSGLYASAVGLMPVNLKNKQEIQKHSFLITGAHPDDPETGCGGTIARITKEGHDVSILYFTKGEAGIPGKNYEESSIIREGEARKACKILGANPLFFGQVDGNTFVNGGEYEKMQKIISNHNPDIVFTQWPIDTHPDHRHLSLLVYGTWLRLNRKFSLYYYEVLTGQQTQTFNPTDFEDISEFEPVKKQACYAHASQNPDEFYKDHIQMSLFRGLECGRKHAEAFVKQSGDTQLI